MKINKAEFVTGAAAAESIPKESLPEIAFAGRSNVGKSSLINSILNRKNLAITSNTPGRTRQINFFNVNDLFFAVDLPGYGYAKVSMAERKKWGEVITEYMRDRKTLMAVVVILDLRHDPTEHDVSMMEMLDDLGIKAIVALTKSDKVKPGQRAQRRTAIARDIRRSSSELIIFSAVTGEGKDEIWRAIRANINSAE